MTAWGFDSVQALVVALQMIGAELYSSSYHKSGKLMLGRADGENDLFRGDGFQFVNAPVLRCLRQIAPPKGQTNGIQSLHVLWRQVRRPSRIVLDQFNLNFGRVLSFVNELGSCSSHRLVRRLKSVSHKSGSGR